MRDIHDHNHLHPFPCLHCHPHTYIRMVQNLIERCLLLHMDRDQCVKALAEHARIRPLVTLTVWKELLKENTDFFQSYFQSLPPRTYYTSRNVQRAPRFARRNHRR
ncbi:Angiotensin-converting enzyme 2 [Handroanthus impetiginosus]|uniref:Angiotensin-converting enzyme 2 n=1 Tax=Handroanthus impetiginosus TaxID=429701 RepID=A0A2G9HN96_9LAMI|nr:Angiotensin-converting enzyme 2 [Handroanthus impetiginosus]